MSPWSSWWNTSSQAMNVSRDVGRIVDRRSASSRPSAPTMRRRSSRQQPVSRRRSGSDVTRALRSRSVMGCQRRRWRTWEIDAALPRSSRWRSCHRVPSESLRLRCDIDVSSILRRASILVNIDMRRYNGGIVDEEINNLDPDVRLLSALADPTRLAIVRELAAEPRSAPAISRRAATSASRPCRTTCGCCKRSRAWSSERRGELDLLPARARRRRSPAALAAELAGGATRPGGRSRWADRARPRPRPDRERGRLTRRERA